MATRSREAAARPPKANAILFIQAQHLGTEPLRPEIGQPPIGGDGGRGRGWGLGGDRGGREGGRGRGRGGGVGGGHSGGGGGAWGASEPTPATTAPAEPPDYRNTSTWHDASAGFAEPSASADPWGAPAATGSATEWGEPATDDWGKASVPASVWGATSAPDASGTDSAGDWGASTNAGGCGESKAAGGWGESTSLGRWGESKSTGAWGEPKSAGGSGEATNAGGSGVGAPEGWGTSASDGWSVSSAWATAGDDKTEGITGRGKAAKDDGPTPTPTAAVKENANSWGMHSSVGWGQPPLTPSQAGSSAHKVDVPATDAPTAGWGTAPTEVPSTKAATASGGNAAPLDGPPARERKAPLPRSTLEEAVLSPADVNRGHAEMGFRRSGSVTSSATTVNLRQDPHRVVEKLIQVQRELAIAEKKAADMKALHHHQTYGHVGHAARARLEALTRDAAKRVHELKKKEVECMDVLAAIPAMTARARAAEEERKQADEYLVQIRQWLDAAEPAVTHAIAARKAQLAHTGARPSKRVKLDVAEDERLEDDEWARLKEDVENLAVNVGKYEATHAGFAGIAKRVEELEKRLSAVSEGHDADTKMVVDGQDEDAMDEERGEVRASSVSQSAAFAIDRLEAATAQLDKLVESCRAVRLEEKIGCLAEDTIALKEKIDQLVGSHDEQCLQAELTTLQDAMQELQTQFSQLSVPPVVPQDEIDALVTAMIQLTEHRLEPYFRALNDAMDETLASSRQQLLSEATRRLAPVLHVVSSCQEYIAKNPQRT